MNFLSHYYFDREKDNAYEVLGMLLPDLLKNTNKTWNPHPEKNLKIFKNKHHQEILIGWQRHLKVDQLFHNSAYFTHHQHQLKLLFKETLKNSPVKPFFLGHVGIELILDSLLITEHYVNIKQLYAALNKVENHIIDEFLKLNNIIQTEKFFSFFEIFKKEEYLFSYSQPQKIAYALKRVCMRIWENPLTQQQEEELTLSIIYYKKELSKDFIFIFEMIDAALN